MAVHPAEDVVENFDRPNDVRALVQHHALGAVGHGSVGDFGPRRHPLFGERFEHLMRVPRSKNGKPHAVPLNASAYAALERLWGARGESPYVFAHAKGKNVGEAMQDLKKGFHTALKNAGIEDFGWHDMRHTFASWLVMRGASLRAVAELLGHQTMQMTMRYAHLSPGYLSNEVSLLDDVGSAQKAKKGHRAQTPPETRAKVREISKGNHTAQ